MLRLVPKFFDLSYGHLLVLVGGLLLRPWSATRRADKVR